MLRFGWMVAAALAGLIGVMGGEIRAGQGQLALVVEGDVVAGVGAVTSIENIAVNDVGGWLVRVDTDHADLARDGLILGAAGIRVREGDSVAAPAGASIAGFDTVILNDSGNSAWNFLLAGTSGGNDDSGLYYNGTLLIQEGAISSAAGFSAGTKYLGFFEAKMTDEDEILVMASVDDLAVATGTDRALVRIDYEFGAGTFAESVVVKENDLLSGQTDLVADLATGPHSFALGSGGDVMFFADLDGNTSDDGVIYLNQTIVGQEGSSSPVAGRTWGVLSGSRMDVNAGGQFVFSGQLSGDANSNMVIVKNGSKFVQEGESLAAIGGVFTFSSFGSGPVEIDDGGNVLWYGDWNDPNVNVDEGLFRNGELLVQEGVTTIGGVVVDTLRGVENGYHMSRSGQFIIFEAVLGNGVEGAFLITIPQGGCASCVGDMDGTGVVDGMDVEGFVGCYLGGSAGVSGCACADIEAGEDGDVDGGDLSAFVERMLEGGGCTG